MLYSTFVRSRAGFILTAMVLLFSATVQGQLVFRNATLETPATTQLKEGAIYRFSQVAADVDALVLVDSLVNGASLTAIDISNTGYNDAFQPTIRPGNIGLSYALFHIRFVRTGTTTPVVLPQLAATNLDIDGNANLKEMSEIDMNGGSSTYMTGTPQISVSMLQGLRFRAMNLTGVEYTGIDTLAQDVMYRVQHVNVSSFKVRLGAVTTTNSSSPRQYSVYMRAVQIANGTTILPVQLLQFTATAKEKRVILDWQTANQEKFSHFAIERSTDAQQFKTVAIVMGAENSATVATYSYTDAPDQQQPNVLYYRLKMVDTDGSYNYSAVKAVRFNVGANISLQVFPNPATNQVAVTLPANLQQQQVLYEVINQQGVRVKSIQQLKAPQVQVVETASLPKGIYYLQVRSGSTVSSKQFIKQ